MRVRIKVMDLTGGQWTWLRDNLPDHYEIPGNAARVCVEFEFDAEAGARHTEMTVRQFVGLLTQLQLIPVAEAMLTPDALPANVLRLPVLPTAEEVRRLSAADAVELTRQLNDGRTCQHGSPVTSASPSVFEGAEPVRTFEDGCQSYGPYGK